MMIRGYLGIMQPRMAALPGNCAHGIILGAQSWERRLPACMMIGDYSGIMQPRMAALPGECVPKELRSQENCALRRMRSQENALSGECALRRMRSQENALSGECALRRMHPQEGANVWDIFPPRKCILNYGGNRSTIAPAFYYFQTTGDGGGGR